jgi:hypothetical protein
MLTFDVLTHAAGGLPDLIVWCDQRKITVAGTSVRKARLHLPEDSPYLAELPTLPQVERIEEYVPPMLFDDRARALAGLDDGNGAPAFALDGNGEIIAVADTGIDDSHPDFAGRLHAQIPKGRLTADDPHGHGTHVTGTAAGSGAHSQGLYRGAAPGAQIVVQSLLDNGGGLGGLPLDLGDLFAEAYALGARIHNNSWGSATRSTYTINASEVDTYANRQQDMLIVFAAGNEGKAANQLNTPPGVVDWLSIGAPGTAKNALTVGASRSDRNAGGYAAMTYGQVWQGHYPDPPISTAKVSGDRDCLAAFSSRGPSDDRRIKPDLVAPGTDIVSCRSSKAPLKNFWGLHPTAPSYAFMGGTSMAAPLVAGCAALVREYYRKRRAHPEPSAALLKATLINGTRWLNGACATASSPNPFAPANFDQGFGCLNMPTTLPAEQSPAFRLHFVDSLGTPHGALVRTGQRRRFALQVGGGAALRICLCYMDTPGRGLQNNLNLFVQDPTGTKHLGNQQLKFGIGLPDVDNNVEVLRVPSPAPGQWLIQIAATNLLRAPQHFALVVTGDLQTDLIEV